MDSRSLDWPVHPPPGPFDLHSLPGLALVPGWPPKDAIGPSLHCFTAGPVKVFMLILPANPGPWLDCLKVAASPGRIAQASRFRHEDDALRCLAAESLLRHAMGNAYDIPPST